MIAWFVGLAAVVAGAATSMALNLPDGSAEQSEYARPTTAPGWLYFALPDRTIGYVHVDSIGKIEAQGGRAISEYEFAFLSKEKAKKDNFAGDAARRSSVLLASLAFGALARWGARSMNKGVDKVAVLAAAFLLPLLPMSVVYSPSVAAVSVGVVYASVAAWLGVAWVIGWVARGFFWSGASWCTAARIVGIWVCSSQ